MVDPFRQAEAQFRQISSDMAAGRIGPDQGRNLINQIRVADVQGRTWMLQEGSGQWFVWQNGQWQAASPYPATPSAPLPNPAYVGGNYAAGDYAASSGAPAYAQGGQQGYQQALPPLEGGWGRLFSKMLGACLAAAVLFALIGLALAIFTDDIGYGDIPKVMAAPAALSVVISFFSLSSQWRGRIVQFVTKRERESGYDDDTVTYRNVTFARLRLENGRTKDVRPAGDWQVGDVIEKRRGEWGSKKLN